MHACVQNSILQYLLNSCLHRHCSDKMCSVSAQAAKATKSSMSELTMLPTHIARIQKKGDDHITCGAISSDGAAFAFSDRQGLHLYQLSAQHDADVPDNIAALNAEAQEPDLAVSKATWQPIASGPAARKLMRLTVPEDLPSFVELQYRLGCEQVIGLMPQGTVTVVDTETAAVRFLYTYICNFVVHELGVVSLKKCLIGVNVSIWPVCMYYVLLYDSTESLQLFLLSRRHSCVDLYSSLACQHLVAKACANLMPLQLLNSSHTFCSAGKTCGWSCQYGCTLCSLPMAKLCLTHIATLPCRWYMSSVTPTTCCICLATALVWVRHSRHSRQPLNSWLASPISQSAPLADGLQW